MSGNNTKDQRGNACLSIIESEPPRFHCPVMQTELTAPCEIRSCGMWSHNTKCYNCAAAFGSMKASHSAERINLGGSKEKRSTLKAAASGKLSFHDLAYVYNMSRQRVEGVVALGKQVMEVLSPLLARIDPTIARAEDHPTKRLGSLGVFSYSGPTAHLLQGANKYKRVCVCCESIVDPDDEDMVTAVLDAKSEVVWCSRECAAELPIDAWLISNRYKRHWTEVALSPKPIDERSRVREITPERMSALKRLANEQGYT